MLITLIGMFMLFNAKNLISVTWVNYHNEISIMK